MAYRAERPKEKAVAESLQQASSRVGIKLTLKALPDRRTTSRSTPASRRYVRANGIGLPTNGWGADWNDGYGFLVADRRQPGDPRDGWLVEPQRSATPRSTR